MIPLRDTNPSRLISAVNYVIIALCVLFFLYEVQLGDNLQLFLHRFGLVPAILWKPGIAAHFTLAEKITPFFTSMFLHGGWMHLIGNMWVLHIFGDNVESALGHGRYIVFYLVCGLVSAAIQVLSSLDSTIPTIGASGAIAGVMGAYFVLYPRAKILTFIPIFFFFTLLEVPAYVFLGFWFFLQFFNGAFALVSGVQGFSGIAWWAHIGGFAAGMILIKFFALGLPSTGRS